MTAANAKVERPPLQVINPRFGDNVTVPTILAMTAAGALAYVRLGLFSCLCLGLGFSKVFIGLSLRYDTILKK